MRSKFDLITSSFIVIIGLDGRRVGSSPFGVALWLFIKTHEIPPLVFTLSSFIVLVVGFDLRVGSSPFAFVPWMFWKIPPLGRTVSSFVHLLVDDVVVVHVLQWKQLDISQNSKQILCTNKLTKCKVLGKKVYCMAVMLLFMETFISKVIFMRKREMRYVRVGEFRACW